MSSLVYAVASTLSKGDIILSEGLFDGLDRNEQMVWKVEDIETCKDGSINLDFDVSYWGLNVASLACNINKDEEVADWKNS